MLIRWLSRAAVVMVDWFTLVVLEPVPARAINKRPRRVFILVMTCWSLVGFGLPFHASSADLAPTLPAKAGRIVAAGFGFQNAETSSITVKTYDAVSGEILSNESYELDIKDDGPEVSQPRERIFAGGVGIGADGLSEFTLRVYDAKDGRFLWEGRLNLRVNSADVEATPVLAHIQPRATMSRISRSSHADVHPYFLLRVVNPETGQVVWSDQFSTERSSVRVERIGRSGVGMTTVAPLDIDFRIQMFDEAGQQLLWEDKVTPAVEENSELSGPREEDAGMIPRWSIGPSDPSISETI